MRTVENVRRYMWPHMHVVKDNQRICAKFIEIPKDIKHGDKVGCGIFRLLENDLYTDDFYQYALPIVKEIWMNEVNL